MATIHKQTASALHEEIVLNRVYRDNSQAGSITNQGGADALTNVGLRTVYDPVTKTTTLYVDHIKIDKTFVAQRNYFQTVVGMNGALMIAPSAKVRNFVQERETMLPSVELTGIEGVTSESAYLKATVYPNGNAVSCWFCYVATSTGAAPIASTAVQTVATGSPTMHSEVYQIISGLSPGVRYEVWMVLEWDSGRKSQTSNKLLFITHDHDDAFIETLMPQSITATGATFCGAAPTGSKMSYKFYVTRISDNFEMIWYSQEEIDDNTNVLFFATASSSLLTPDTSYRVMAMAVDLDANIYLGHPIQFSTPPSTITTYVLPTISQPTAGNITETTADIACRIIALGEFWYRVWRWEELDSTPVLIVDWTDLTFATQAEQIINISLTDLVAATRYYVQIEVMNNYVETNNNPRSPECTFLTNDYA